MWSAWRMYASCCSSHVELAISLAVQTEQAQHVLRSLRTLKIQRTPFDNRAPNDQWHGNAQIMHNNSRIIKMAFGETPNGRRWVDRS